MLWPVAAASGVLRLVLRPVRWREVLGQWAVAGSPLVSGSDKWLWLLPYLHACLPNPPPGVSDLSRPICYISDAGADIYNSAIRAKMLKFSSQ